MSDEEVDFAAYDKDEPGESKSAKAAVKAADAKVVKKDDDDAAEKSTHDKAVADVKAKLTTEEKAILLTDYMAQQPTSSPITRGRYDHDATLKCLVKTASPVRALMETVKDNIEVVFYMAALCDYWKSCMHMDRLPVYVKAPPSPNVSTV